MAVFKDFDWDNAVLDFDGNPLTFKQVNIIFGRNYSGKTTLSRIVRAFETGNLSDKYAAPTFKLSLQDGTILTEEDYEAKSLLTRVFNEDFIRDNLQFVVNPDSDILPFAVLGEDNARIEAEIIALKSELGIHNGDSSTGLYKELILAKEAAASAEQEATSAKNALERQKNTKATDREIGIKYQFNRFGKQNYNIRDLNTDIETVQCDAYISLTAEELSLCETALIEQKKEEALEIKKPSFRLDELISSCKELCERKIGSSEKIQELLRNAALERWVRQGIELNKDKDRCAFCGQPITSCRWEELNKHFDEETDTLNSDITTFLKNVEAMRALVDEAFIPDASRFYSVYTEKINDLKKEYDEFKTSFYAELDRLIVLAEKRQNNIHEEIAFEYTPVRLSSDDIFDRYEVLREASNKHGSEIATAKRKAQNALRLYEVKKFIDEIDYTSQICHISELESVASEKQTAVRAIVDMIEEKENLIESKNRLMNDEEKGAVKVNEYLSTYFGHRYLSLQAVTTEEYGSTKVHFEVVRNGEKAYHLSEGECSLIAFCYFVAKLDDIETVGKKPIIWIDDPISSLDSNHIYFVYSLITKEILKKDCYEQLFITTHNLQFLKYLRVLSINNHSKDKKNNNNRANFVVERYGNFSSIKDMPYYLKKHGTEFNHWFENIYKCSQQSIITDENLYLFESFGNNARKFFETYLYYRYPDKNDFNEHITRFFGDKGIPPIIVRKVCDEQSHGDGDLENHDSPFEEPETIEAAKLIIERLKEIDMDQYEALVSTVQ